MAAGEHRDLPFDRRLPQRQERQAEAARQRLRHRGEITANGGTAAEFGKFIDDETRKWGEVIRAAGLKGE